MLDNLNIDGKDLRIIKNMYWQQKAAIKIDNETGTFQHIKQGVRQGCVLSPDLFNLYSEIIMRSIQDMPGISIGGHNINNLRYADDTVLIAEKETHLQEMINIIAKESLSKGLSLNTRKTEVMVITKNKCPPECNIKVDGISLKQVNNFKYLGTLITADGRCIKEIKSRVTQAKATFHKMKNILCNMSLSIEVRKRVLRSYIEPILLYGSESWTINRLARNHIEATEM